MLICVYMYILKKNVLFVCKNNVYIFYTTHINVATSVGMYMLKFKRIVFIAFVVYHPVCGYWIHTSKFDDKLFIHKVLYT